MEGTQASNFFLNVPEEILEIIFSFLDQPRDLVSVAGTTAQFRRIVNGTMPVAVFSEVFPLIISELEGNDILNCRLVCKDWSDSVDKYLQTNPVMRVWEPYPYYPTKANECMDIHLPLPASYVPHYHPHLFQKGLRGPMFSTSANVLDFMTTMEHHPRNPFTMRTLGLMNNVGLEPDPEVFWSQVDVMLATFGHHIWQLEIYVQVTVVDHNVVLQCYIILQQILQHLPNLRLLAVHGFNCHTCFHRDDQFYLRRLKQYITAHPLPELPDLRIFESTLKKTFKTQPVLDEVMRRYSSQLEKVDMDFSTRNQHKTLQPSLPNLTVLHTYAGYSTYKCIRLFRSLHLPRIGKLCLTFHEPVWILKILKSFKQSLPTLTYLQMHFNSLPKDHNANSTSLGANFELENIKTLEVYQNIHAVYVPMIVVMPALERILITYEGYISPNVSLCDGELTIVRGYMITQSNIWEKLKSLKEFTFARLGESDLETDIIFRQQFTRDMYERSRHNSSREDLSHEE